MTGATLLRIGSRASNLARAQAEWVAERVRCCTALVWVRSSGDQDQKTPLQAFGQTGVFTRELNAALRDDRVDAAVHSLKDLPTEEEPGLLLACVPVREDVRDALITRDGLALRDLPKGARVGTGSPRRKAQLLRVRPDLQVEGLRGNVETRFSAVTDGRLDGVILAMAGLRRLGRINEMVVPLDLEDSLPAASQGALGLLIRVDDSAAEQALASLRDVQAAACVSAERSALNRLGAGCHAPVGAHARVIDGRLHLRVRVLSLDGQTVFERDDTAGIAEATALGAQIGDALLADGAGPLVEMQ
jgi:hydroxymethylbilane synthase